MCPLPPAASFQKPARQCAPHTLARWAFQLRTRRCESHTPSRSALQIPARRCASHTPPRLTFQTQNEPVCTPHTGSFGLPNPNEAVCNPHTVSFDLPNANEVVCIPHTVSFGLPDANERCASHTPLRSSFFIPAPSFGGDSFMQTARTRWCEIHTPPCSSCIIFPNDGGIYGVVFTPPQFRFILPPQSFGGGFFFAAQMTGAA